MLIRTSGRGVAVVAAAVGLLVAVASAPADTVTCTAGVGASVTPAIQRVPALAGDSEFAVGGTGGCQYVDTSGPGAGTAYTTDVSVSSTGIYRNDVCLTGWIVSNWDNPIRPGRTTLDFVNPNATDVTSMRYLGRLTGGAGPFTIKDINGNPSLVGDGWQLWRAETGSGSCVDPGGITRLTIFAQFAMTL